MYDMSTTPIVTVPSGREIKDVYKRQEQLFQGENPIGKTVEIQKEPFVVVGVVSPAVEMCIRDRVQQLVCCS